MNHKTEERGTMQWPTENRGKGKQWTTKPKKETRYNGQQKIEEKANKAPKNTPNLRCPLINEPQFILKVYDTKGLIRSHQLKKER